MIEVIRLGTNDVDNGGWDHLVAGKIYLYQDRIILLVDALTSFEIRINQNFYSKTRQTILCWVKREGIYKKYSIIQLDDLIFSLLQ